MKASIFIVCLVAGFGQVYSQSNFGIAYYQIPAGWQIVQQSPSIILEEKGKSGTTCRIILSASEQVVIDKEKSYITYRQTRSSGDLKYSNPGTVIRKENPYCISYATHTTEIKNKKSLKSSFYTFTNGNQSFFVQFLSEDVKCDAGFSYFLKNLEVEEWVADKPESGPSKIKSKVGGKPRGRPRKNPA